MTDNQAGPLFGVRLPRGIVTYLNGQPIRTQQQAQEALRVMGRTLGEWGTIEAVNDRPWPGALAGVGEHRPDQPQNKDLVSAQERRAPDGVSIAGVCTCMIGNREDDTWTTYIEDCSVHGASDAAREARNPNPSPSTVQEQEAT